MAYLIMANKNNQYHAHGFPLKGLPVIAFDWPMTMLISLH